MFTPKKIKGTKYITFMAEYRECTICNKTMVVKVVQNIEHNSFGQEKFDATLKELQSERDTVKGMDLI